MEGNEVSVSEIVMHTTQRICATSRLIIAGSNVGVSVGLLTQCVVVGVPHAQIVAAAKHRPVVPSIIDLLNNHSTP